MVKKTTKKPTKNGTKQKQKQTVIVNINNGKTPLKRQPTKPSVIKRPQYINTYPVFMSHEPSPPIYHNKTELSPIPVRTLQTEPLPLRTNIGLQTELQPVKTTIGLQTEPQPVRTDIGLQTEPIPAWVQPEFLLETKKRKRLYNKTVLKDDLPSVPDSFTTPGSVPKVIIIKRKKKKTVVPDFIPNPEKTAYETPDDKETLITMAHLLYKSEMKKESDRLNRNAKAKARRDALRGL